MVKKAIINFCIKAFEEKINRIFKITPENTNNDI